MTTYLRLAQFIRDTYYKGQPNDEAGYSVRFFAEMIAGELAKIAVESAWANSKMGEPAFASDQMTTPYYNLPLLHDNMTNRKYVTMPAAPAGLPGGREVAQVTFVSCPTTDVVVIPFKDLFSQRMIGDPKCFDIAYQMGGKLWFEYLSPLAEGPVNMVLVGAVPTGDDFLNAELHLSKDQEVDIKDRIIQKLTPAMRVQQDTLNDGISQA